ncbi:transglutaminase-like domain-containing protein [Acinetobacter bereziniae]|uniref:transglutaminase-like domain-containing protein n=1 Tax=Acinetobacter bereziniae TaxID=106648 RepID=UPI0012501989|nr:transglutaminase family protein [Acinetobacter bereziniae]
MNKFLEETKMLNFKDPLIEDLIKQRKWGELNEIDKVINIYNFVRDEIKFGYNSADTIQASQVLNDGYGQCNTKATLLMALLRAEGIATRLHGFTIDKALQKGAIDGIWYKLSPKNILHSWVEVYLDQRWYILEGVIIDRAYLKKLKNAYPEITDTFCGFGVYTDHFDDPNIDWYLNDTFIQDKGINQDFGFFDSPDEFYQDHQQGLSRVQQFIFKHLIRYLMNRNVNKIRG